jgi:hypothetical protein
VFYHVFSSVLPVENTFLKEALSNFKIIALYVLHHRQMYDQEQYTQRNSGKTNPASS